MKDAPGKADADVDYIPGKPEVPSASTREGRDLGVSVTDIPRAAPAVGGSTERVHERGEEYDIHLQPARLRADAAGMAPGRASSASATCRSPGGEDGRGVAVADRQRQAPPQGSCSQRRPRRVGELGIAGLKANVDKLNLPPGYTSSLGRTKEMPSAKTSSRLRSGGHFQYLTAPAQLESWLHRSTPIGAA